MFSNDSQRLIVGKAGAFLVIWSLFCNPAYGQEAESSAPPPAPTPSIIHGGANPTPVAQALVPEGVFAMQLADVLKLGPVADEAKAEALLSSLGIEPKNGWLSEYPVTPAVLGDIDQDIAAACDQGKIPLAKDQALKRVGELKTRLGLDVKPGFNAPPASRSQRSGITTIYTFTGSKGEKYYTDNFDSIPAAYRDQAKAVSYSPPPSAPSSMTAGEPDVLSPQYAAVPNPDVINSYYEDQGPPAVTYYSPPEPYYYLYSWTPYPFWYSGFYFPGFFVLNNFHRHADIDRHPYTVSHHTGPVRGGIPGRLTPSGWYAAPGAQAGARAIVNINQNRPVNGAEQIHRDEERGIFSSTGNTGVMNNTPAVRHEGAMTGHDVAQAPAGSGGRFFNQPPIPGSGGRFFNQPPPPGSGGRFINQPPVVNQQPSFVERPYVPDRPSFRSPSVFDERRELNPPHGHEEHIFIRPHGFEGGDAHGEGSFRGHEGAGGGSRGGRR